MRYSSSDYNGPQSQASDLDGKKTNCNILNSISIFVAVFCSVCASFRAPQYTEEDEPCPISARYRDQDMKSGLANSVSFSVQW